MGVFSPSPLKSGFSFGKYNKLWVALVGGVVTVLVGLYGKDNGLVQALVQFLTVTGVFSVPNAT